jgi:hypothetical protein
MTLSFSSLLKNTAPAPAVVLLPGTLFFYRIIPVEPGILPADLAAQVGLALEALAPFPLTQLYYGYYNPGGSSVALVYAAYRKRFTSEQTAAWTEADLVIPSFVALLGGETKPATTLLLSTAEELIALHWREGQVPEKILTHAFAPDAPEEERAKVRDDTLQSIGESLKVIDLPAAPVSEPREDEDHFALRSGDFVSRLPVELADQLDVRDKDELAFRRRARMRDLVLWRIFVGCAAALAFCLVSEFALIGGKIWQKARVAAVEKWATAVEKIMDADSLSKSISARSTGRLMPFEMIALVTSCKPASVQFIRASTTEKDKLEIDAQTNATNDFSSYKTALASLPACMKVEMNDERSRDGLSTCKFIVTFKPDALKPAAS